MKGQVRASFSPARPPLQDFRVVLCVLPNPGTVDGSGAWPQSDAVGYYWTLGIRVAPERLRALLESLVTEGVIHWDETEFERVDPNALEPSIRSRAEPVDAEGVWYKSGRVFFSEW